VKQSYYTTPRSMSQAQWAFDADPIERYPQSRQEAAYGVVLAVVIGIGLAVALVAWWSA
jgi:hypothetical protein